MDMQQKRMIVCVILVAICTLFFVQSTQSEHQGVIVVQGDSTEKPEDLISRPETISKEVVVHVAGAVKNPGVYTLQEGDRIEDAIAQAGLLLESDADALNRAALLSDGQKIVVPFQSETHSINSETGIEPVRSDTVTQNTNKKINLNQADITQLMTLPGIGEVKAQAIIRYRQEHNGFQTVEELLQVNGIGTVIYSQIAEMVCI